MKMLAEIDSPENVDTYIREKWQKGKNYGLWSSCL